jgi:hypothetical protein
VLPLELVHVYRIVPSTNAPEPVPACERLAEPAHVSHFLRCPATRDDGRLPEL